MLESVDGIIDAALPGLYLVEKLGQLILIHGLWGRCERFKDVFLSSFVEGGAGDGNFVTVFCVLFAGIFQYLPDATQRNSRNNIGCFFEAV